MTGSVACLSVAKFPGGAAPPAATEAWTLAGRSFLAPAVSVDLRWTPLSGAVTTDGFLYRVYESDTLPILTGAPVATVNGTAATIVTSPGSHYYLVVSANAGGGVSSPYVEVDTIPVGHQGLIPSMTPIAIVAGTNGGAGTVFESFGRAATGVGDLNLDGFDDIVVGDAYFDNSGGGVDHGMVRLWLGTSNGLKPTSPWTFKGSANDFVGISVAGIGDYNNDGTEDVAVGVPRVDPSAGAVLLFNGAAMSVGASSFVTLPDPLGGTAPGSLFGHSLSGGRDVNGDGLTDLLVGAWLRGGGVLDGYGSAHAYSAQGGSAVLAHVTNGSDSTAELGKFVGAGDVDNDGIADVLIGEPGLKQVRVFAGSPLITGAASKTPSEATWTITSTLENFGERLAAGDVDGDGFEDVLVGSRPSTGTVSGAFLFRGPLSQTGPTPGDTVSDWDVQNGTDWHLGSSVDLVDVNGDGYKDALIGETDFQGGGTGRASMYRGGPGGLEPPGQSPPWFYIGAPGAKMGAWVSHAGDVDGDGSQDFLVGATGLPGGLPTDERTGDRAYLFRGAPVHAPVVMLDDLKADVDAPVSMEITKFSDPGRVGGGVSCSVDWGAPSIVNPPLINNCSKAALETLPPVSYPVAGFYRLRVRITNAAGLTAETATTVLISQ